MHRAVWRGWDRRSDICCSTFKNRKSIAVRSGVGLRTLSRSSTSRAPLLNLLNNSSYFGGPNMSCHCSAKWLYIAATMCSLTTQTAQLQGTVAHIKWCCARLWIGTSPFMIATMHILFASWGVVGAAQHLANQTLKYRQMWMCESRTCAAAGINLCPHMYVHLNRYSIAPTSDYTAQLTWLSQDENMMRKLMFEKGIHCKGSSHCNSVPLHITILGCVDPSMQPYY